jgi:colicin import membrane protein
VSLWNHGHSRFVYRVMARLKVFAARMGFFDTIIAAPSQKAALLVWGTQQNLFHDGAARISDDPGSNAAALARPGVLLRRPAGSKAPFVENPPPAPTRPMTNAIAKPVHKARAPGKLPHATPDRSGLESVEAALQKLDADHRRECRELVEQIAVLKRRAVNLDRSHRRARDVLKRRLAVARRDYRGAADR